MAPTSGSKENQENGATIAPTTLTNNMNINNSDNNRSDNENDDGDDDDNDFVAECGIWRFKPLALRMCANMPLFTGIYSVSAFMTSTLIAYVNSQVTTLERHFGFNSAQTGLIMAANDIGFLAIVLFVSFIAAKVHIPRALGFFTILFGISGIVCALPQFLFGAPSPSTASSANDVIMANVTAMTSARPSGGGFRGQMCDVVNRTTVDCDAPLQDTQPLSHSGELVHESRLKATTALGIIVVGMILQGVAKTPRGSFSVVYVDANVDKVKTGWYMGIIIAIAIMGPAMAFALGGVFSRIYVTLEETDMHFRHPRWIGAWWLGYVTFGVGACLVALPLFCFPRRMRKKGRKENKEGGGGGEEREKEKGEKQPAVVTTKEGRVNAPRRLTEFMKDFLGALVRLISNPVYMFTTLSSCSLLFSVAGSQSFTPKYIENQFAFPAWKANMAMAGVTLGTACLGTFIGGYLSKRLKMGPLTSIKFVIGVTTLSVTSFALEVVFKCDQPYLYNSPGPRAANNISAETCLQGCWCDDEDYFPVCAQDGRTFFSPCHAGCKETEKGLYVNCTCIEGGTAVAGTCDYSCDMFYPFIFFFCTGALFGTLAIIPKLIIKIRSVEERDKPLALGFASFMTSTTGWMLGPICFGKMIDGICIQWESNCGGGGGACRLYDNDNFRLKLMGYQTIFRALALGFIILTYVSARITGKFDPRAKGDSNNGELLFSVIAGGDKKKTDAQSTDLETLPDTTA